MTADIRIGSEGKERLSFDLHQAAVIGIGSISFVFCLRRLKWDSRVSTGSASPDSSFLEPAEDRTVSNRSRTTACIRNP